MKRLHEHTSLTCLDVDVAQRPKRHSPTRIKRMQHAPTLTILRELLLKCPEHFRGNGFELEAHLIYCAVATFIPVAVLAAQPVGKKLPLFGQGILRRRSHFGQCQSTTPPSNDVTGRRDIDLDCISTTIDRACLEDLKELRMQRPSIESKRQFGDFRSYGQHGSKTPNVLLAYNQKSDE